MRLFDQLLIAGAILFVLLVMTVAAGPYVLRTLPLARPDGVPPQARNLGSIIKPTYWHWCEETNGVRRCETYTRNGGIRLYSGLYLPVAPDDILRLRGLDAATFPEAAEILSLLRMRTVFSDGYNWPLAERVSPLDVRDGWRYRFAFPDCLDAISRSDIDGFLEQAGRWRNESGNAYLGELISLFETINVHLQPGPEQELHLTDTEAGVSGTVAMPPQSCYGHVYLNTGSEGPGAGR